MTDAVCFFKAGTINGAAAAMMVEEIKVDN